MLKYKIKGNNVEVNWEAFDLNELYLSPNLDFLSGTTDVADTIYNGSNVILRKKDDDSFTRKMTAEVTNVNRIGHVEYQDKIKEETVYTSYINEEGETVNVNRKYVIYNDTVYFKAESNSSTDVFTLQSDSDWVNGYYIGGSYYTTDSDGYVYVNVKSYIENGLVSVGERFFRPFYMPILVGDTYSNAWVLKYDEDSVTLSKVNDRDYNVVMYDTPVTVQKVILRTSGNEPISVEKVTCGTYRSYVEYDNNNYEIVLNDGKYGAFIPYDGTYIFREASYDDPLPTKEAFALTTTSMTITNSDGYEIEYPVSSTLTESQNGYFLIINTVDENRYDEGSLVYVRSKLYNTKQIEVIADGNDFYANLCGNRYYAVPHDYDVVEINDVEYKLNYTDSNFTKAYIVVDGNNNDLVIENNSIAKYVNPMFVKVSSGGTHALTDYINQSWSGASEYVNTEYGSNFRWDSSYDVTSGYGITIDDVTYQVKTDSKGMKFIEIPVNEEYILRIQRIIGSNMLLCRPKTYNTLYPITSDEDASSICAAIALAADDMEFYILDDTLGERKVTPANCVLDTIMPKYSSGTYTYQVKEPMSSLDVHGINGNLDFYHEVAYHKVPVLLNSYDNVGLMKEDETTNAFVNDYSKANINHIVDMEKMKYRMITASGGTEVMNFVITLSGDAMDTVKNILNRRSDGSVPENIKSSFFRMSFYSTDDTQNQRHLGNMCLMLGPATLPNSEEPGGLIYSGNSSTITEDEEVNLILSYDKAVSKEGFDLYYFKEYFDGEERLDAFMRLDFNNAKTGQIMPLTWRSDEIPIDELGPSLYYSMQLIYDESTTYKYGFSPVIEENDPTWTIDGDTLYVRAYIPKLKDESGLGVNENDS